MVNLRLPLRWGIAGALVTGLLTLLWPDTYRSAVTLLPAEARTFGGGGAGEMAAAAAAALGVSLPGQDANDANYTEIVNSRWMMEELLRTSFTFTARHWRFGSAVPHSGTLYAYLKPKDMDAAVRKAASMVSANRDIKTKVINIYADTPSPELSQLLARRARELLERFVQEKGRTRGGHKAMFAAARLQEARGEMAQAEAEFGRFLDRNRNFLTSPDPVTRLTGLRLEGELKLRQNLVATLAVGREQALMEEKNDIPILNVLNGGNLPIRPSGPDRPLAMAAAFLVVGAVAGAWVNRAWLKERLLEKPAGEAAGGTHA